MSSVILCIMIEKSDVTLTFICGHRMEQMSEVNQIQPFWGRVSVCRGGGVGKEYVNRGKVHRGRCELEELGFQFRKHADVTAFGCPALPENPSY